MSADGSELSSKRVSKLSRRYHLHKKQLRQSARMVDVLPDAAAADGGNDDGDRSGGQFDSSADAKHASVTACSLSHEDFDAYHAPGGPDRRPRLLRRSPR